MAQRENADQRRVERHADIEETADASRSSASTSLDDDVDSILDEIDSVLEENAEEFVKSFVQKGGQ